MDGCVVTEVTDRYCVNKLKNTTEHDLLLRELHQLDQKVLLLS